MGIESHDNILHTSFDVILIELWRLKNPSPFLSPLRTSYIQPGTAKIELSHFFL